MKDNRTTLKKGFFAETETFFKLIEDQTALVEVHKFNPKN